MGDTMKIYNSLVELIGNTPLLRLKNIEKKYDLCANVYAKLEYLNPAGSTKDRAALYMLEAAEREGKINSNTVIIEPTSGNTGIGLAAVAAVKGYRTIIVMPDNMSKERIMIMRAYGAEVVLTDGSLGMKGAIARAEELAQEFASAFIPSQFDNKNNALAHFETTGPEIYDALDGNVDAFVAGVGTGGTITGVGRFLKSKKDDIKIIAVEPKNSPYLSEGKSGAHGIQGIGAGFVPKVLDTGIYDSIVTVTEQDAFAAARSLGKSEGVLVGISSGAALYTAIELAKKKEYSGKNIVVLLPDTGDRYLSTPLFEED